MRRVSAGRPQKFLRFFSFPLDVKVPLYQAIGASFLFWEWLTEELQG